MAVTVRFVGSGDSFGSGGRFQTCILVDGPRSRFAIDCGASSLTALAQQDIEHNSIDAILLTHLHGDHCGGVPFLLMDAMLSAKGYTVDAALHGADAVMAASEHRPDVVLLDVRMEGLNGVAVRSPPRDGACSPGRHDDGDPRCHPPAEDPLHGGLRLRDQALYALETPPNRRGCPGGVTSTSHIGRTRPCSGGR
jgi:hypothetical protein